MRVAVICDFLEERWPSMDLVGDMLVEQLKDAPGIEAARIRPPMKIRFARVPGAAKSPAAQNADRLVNRFYDYPRYLRRHRDFDLFHIVDHSYAQLVHALPPSRVVVTCHDLDTFRCVLEPGEEPRSRPFRAMARRILRGLGKARRITCVSMATRDDLLAYGVAPPERLTVIPNGVHPSCSPYPQPDADLEAAQWLGPDGGGGLDILHVGSTIQRKRIDLLLRIFGGIRERFPRARLIRAGGRFTPQQEHQLRQAGLVESVVVLPFISRPVLAAVYRRAALVLQPSDREGFGLPVAEAMACGATVIASDLPVLREVGGEAASYCAVGNIAEWVNCAGSLINERSDEPDRWRARVLANLEQAARFSWVEYANRMTIIYREMHAEA